MYMGDSMDAMPTPMPAQNLANIKMSLVGEKAMPSEDTAKMSAATNKPGLRPDLSAIRPAHKHPSTAPRAKLPVANPSQ